MTPNTTPQARLGTVEEVGGKHVLRYERRLNHPVERVWTALTEPQELAAWLAAAEQFEPTEGGRVALRWLNVPDDRSEWEKHGVKAGDGSDYDPDEVVRGTITRLDPPHLIEYDTDLMGRMRWELRADGSACVLTFTNTAELPEGHPPEQTLAGWHLHLDHLADTLEGRPVEWSTWTQDHMGEWAALRDRYAADGG